MISIAEARAALQAAIATGDARLIAATRLALAAAEATAEDGEDESVDGKKARAKKAKKMAEDESEAEAEGAEGEEPEAEDDGEEPAAEGESEESEAEGEESEDDEPHEEPDGDEEPPSSRRMRRAKYSEQEASVQRLLSALGASSVAQAIGRATAAREAMAAAEKASRKLAKLERAAKSAKLDKLFAAAARDGRVTRAEIDHLRPLYAGRPLAEAEAYLQAKPRVVSTEFATESAAHYPSAPVLAGVNLAAGNAPKFLASFGLTPEQVAARAAERGMAVSYPGAVRNGGSK